MTAGRAQSRAWLAAGLLFALHLCSSDAIAQVDSRIRQRRDELERIRQERAELERQMKELQSTAHDLTAEVNNLDRRAAATAKLVTTLDLQLVAISAEVHEASNNVRRAEAELGQKRSILRRRLVDIYKRGPTYTPQALLSATSFGELVTRYKYLHLLALRDRSLVQRVEQLRSQVQRERDRLMSLQRGLGESRLERQREADRLAALEEQQREQLARVQGKAKRTQDRIAQMRRSEQQLASTLAALDAERRRAVANRPATARATSSIRTSDYGKLDWPVQGPLVYTFGRAVQSNNTAIRWNGVGIRANVGVPVKSVAAGRAVTVRPVGTYGLTVIVEHGGGDYSIYGSLERANVKEGDAVVKGQVIGSVGISDPELPPHLHFEIRHGRGEAVDPATWLRRQ
ncbi:MAG TPA: peptidoglycan DD-metalloendopeptidase family protein [Gemmatimonadaceae bacterium]|nr:peptidoglycan DD-metalloendopeptidase family protein [Gemmatimonadaceae bacterium]